MAGSIDKTVLVGRQSSPKPPTTYRRPDRPATENWVRYGASSAAYVQVCPFGSYLMTTRPEPVPTLPLFLSKFMSVGHKYGYDTLGAAASTACTMYTACVAGKTAMPAWKTVIAFDWPASYLQRQTHGGGDRYLCGDSERKSDGSFWGRVLVW